SITDIQLLKPRRSPGKVLPPEPAKPSKIDELQLQVISQVKNKYSANMLGDAIGLLGGEDYQDRIQEIRGTLKSEAEVQKMIADVEAKKEFWDKKVKELSDTSMLKEIEAKIQAIQKEKNFLKQAELAGKLSKEVKLVEQ